MENLEQSQSFLMEVFEVIEAVWVMPTMPLLCMTLSGILLWKAQVDLCNSPVQMVPERGGKIMLKYLYYSLYRAEGR